MELGQIYRPKVTMDSPADEAQRRAELLVSQWHARNRMYLGQGAGIDWQAKKSLIIEITAALAGPLAQIERLREDVAAAPAKPKRAPK
jgi:hypothetical protein